MSGSKNSKQGETFLRFPSRELDASIEVLAAFITSGVRDQIEKLRREFEALRDRVDSESPSAVEEEECFLNQRQAAEFLGCSKTFIRKQRREGNFPEPVRLTGRDLRWARSALSRWAEERQGEEKLEE